MAEESFPFQELAEGDRTVSAALFAKHLGMLRTRGAIKGVDNALALAESSPPAMSVDIDTGAALVGLTALRAFRNTLPRTIPVDAADPTNPRHDLVVLDMDTNTGPPDTRRVTALIVKGTPAATPVDPALTQTEAHYQLPLARIVVSAATPDIESADLVDLRGTTDAAAVAWSRPANLVAKRLLHLAATAFTPPSSNGAAAATVHGANFSYPVLDYDQSTDEHADVWFVMPAEYAGGAITVELRWIAASGAGGVSWEIKTVYVTDANPFDVAPLSRINVDDVLGGTGNLYVASGAITPANGLPAAGDTVLLRITRDTADADDTLTADARLLGVTLHFDTTEV